MTLTRKSITTTAQPGSPASGDSYYIPSGATGAAWAGKDDNIGVWSQFEVWVFGTPSGEVVYVVEDEPTSGDNARMVYRAADTFDHIPAVDSDPGSNSFIYYDTATNRWTSFTGMNTAGRLTYTKAGGELAGLPVSAGNVVGVASGGTEIASLTGTQLRVILGMADTLGTTFVEVSLGALPNSTVNSVAHGATIDFTKKQFLSGSARQGSTSNSIALPYSQHALSISMSIDATNINVKSNFDASDLTGSILLGYS